MANRSRYIFGVAMAGVITLGAGAAAAAARGVNADPEAEQQSEHAYTDAHRADAAISQNDAERLAQQARPGTIIESHLQTEGDGLRWEVKIDDGRNVWEIQLDPASGAIVGNQADE